METSFQLPKTGQLIRETWKIYTKKFGVFFTLVLPILFWNLIVLQFDLQNVKGLSVILFFIASFLIGMFTQAALFGNIAHGGSFDLAFKTFTKYLWTSIISTMILITGFILLIVPGVIWSLWFTFSMAIVADEGTSGLQPLVKSSAYVRGHILQIFGRSLVFGLLVAIPAIIISIIAGYFPFFSYVREIYNALILPISAAFLYNLYQHLKSNKPITVSLEKEFKTAAWIGFAITLALLVLSIVYRDTLLPKLENLQETQDIKLENNTQIQP